MRLIPLKFILSFRRSPAAACLWRLFASLEDQNVTLFHVSYSPSLRFESNHSEEMSEGEKARLSADQIPPRENLNCNLENWRHGSALQTMSSFKVTGGEAPTTLKNSATIPFVKENGNPVLQHYVRADFHVLCQGLCWTKTLKRTSKFFGQLVFSHIKYCLK